MPLLATRSYISLGRRQDGGSGSSSGSSPTATVTSAGSSGSGNSNSGPTTGAIVAISIAASVFVIFSILFYITYRRRRAAKQAGSQKQSSGGGFFSRWRSNSIRGAYSAQLQPTGTNQTNPQGEQLSRRNSPDVEMQLSGSAPSTTVPQTATEVAAPAAAATQQETTAGVDRNTSVRSVMTLPPYSPGPRPTEQVLGREGERAGIDRVVEQPETVDEVEERRDDEMESLYQIRQARRAEAADREERRRLRREARARGDNVTLARLQAEHRARQEANASGVSLSQQLIAEHQNKNRDRRVSSVQYFDVGVARHDGTRVRAPSIESSDSTPLLDSAATFGDMPLTPGEGPPRPPFAQSPRYRQSSTSVASVVSSLGSAGLTPAQDFDIVSLQQTRSRPESQPHSIHARSHQTLPMPTIEPPNYDYAELGDAPPYESPVAGRGERVQHLPISASLPAIQISSATSAAGSSPRSAGGRSLTRPRE